MVPNQRNALFATIAITALHNANAFAPSVNSFSSVARPTYAARRQPFATRPLYESTIEREQTQDQEVSASSSVDEPIMESMEHANETKPIMDIPPSPSSAKKPSPKAASKGAGNPHKEGIFSPLVLAAGSILGQEQLNQIRAKTISLHSDIIKSFVDTSDSEFGKAVLKQLFKLVDVDDSGYLDKEEVGMALKLLGFKWLQEKHVEKIFERADLDENGEISLEEFMVEAPKTLRTNLVKLAKSNGGDMGLLV